MDQLRSSSGLGLWNLLRCQKVDVWRADFEQAEREGDAGCDEGRLQCSYEKQPDNK